MEVEAAQADAGGGDWHFIGRLEESSDPNRLHACVEVPLPLLAA